MAHVCLIKLAQVVHPGTEPLLDVVITSAWQKLTFVPAQNRSLPGLIVRRAKKLRFEIR